MAANIAASNLDSVKDDKKLMPMIYYINTLQTHKEYLDFFEIGVVRDQKKKIANVAKYVGLAIKDYSYIHEKAEDAKNEKKHKAEQKEDLSGLS